MGISLLRQKTLISRDAIILGALAIFGMYLASRYNYLLFHGLAEMFSIVVACAVFFIVWNSRRYSDNHYLLFIGVAYLFVAGIDFLHLLAYRGMGVFPGHSFNSNLATQLWVAARYLQAASLVAAPFFLDKKFKLYNILWVYSGVFTLLLLAIFSWHVFPDAFVEGQGLTVFKRASEYAIAATLVLAILLLYMRRHFLEKNMLKLLIAALVLTIVSELSFTLYSNAYGIPNTAGHLLKIAAFYLFYKAVIESALKKPYSSLFRGLKQQERLYEDALIYTQSVIDTVWEPLLVLDKELKVKSANKSFYDLFKLPPDKVEGQYVFEIDNGQWNIAELIKRLKEVAAKGKRFYDFEVRSFSSRIGDKVFALTSRLIERSDNRPSLVLVSIANITDRKKYEQGLEAHALELTRLADDLRKFKLAVENASDHIVITDADGLILYANKAVERITGFSPKETIGKKAGGRDLWGGLMSAEFYHALWQKIKADKRVFAGEVTNRRKNGEEYIAAVSVSPVLDRDKKVVFFVGIERDVTEAKAVDRAKTEFISLAAHQLRTPLATISLTAEMLLKGVTGEISREGKKYLRDIFQDIHGMADLIDIFLNVSRIEMGKFIIDPKPEKIADLVDGFVREILPQAKDKGIVVRCDYDKRIAKMALDAKAMRVAIENLLANALKYTARKGQIAVGIKKQGRNVVIAVQDTGCGIPVKDQPRIFEKTFRASNVADSTIKGMGLGLYVVKSIVDQAGGKIWLESPANFGKPKAKTKTPGTAFYISFPLKGMKSNLRS